MTLPLYCLGFTDCYVLLLPLPISRSSACVIEIWECWQLALIRSICSWAGAGTFYIHLFSDFLISPETNKNWYVHVFSDIHVQKPKKTIQQLVGWLVVWIVCSVCCVFPIFTYFRWDQVFRMTLTRFGLKVPIRIWFGRVIPVTKIHEDHKFGPAQFALALQAGLATLGDRVPAEEHRYAEGNQFAFGCLDLQCSRRLRAKNALIGPWKARFQLEDTLHFELLGKIAD